MTQAVLFDVDGTLVDSNDAHARAWVVALAQAGYEVPFEQIRSMIGMGGDLIMPQVTDGLDAESEGGKAISESRKKHFLENELARVRPFPDARALLEAVRVRGGRVVVATSSSSTELEKILALGDFNPLVDVKTTSDDAQASKPAPDIIVAALEKAGVAAGDAIMIGDTTYDVEAAHKAGVSCVALRSGGNDPQTLRAAEAVYANPAELTAALGDYPFDWTATA